MNLFQSCFTNICICFFLSTLSQISLAGDTLALNQSITDGDGQALVSPGEKFELCFLSPGKSKNRYLGIRYKTTPDVIVWIANRNTPITDLGGVFTISSNGTLLLLNSTKNIVWSSNISRVADNPVVKLFDTGNLVLIDNMNNYLWQSFDNPGNTQLPGMLMRENLQYLTSWRNSDDPSPGNFTYRVENLGLPMIILSVGNRRRYRTGPWNGIQFNGLPTFPNPREMAGNSFYDPYNSSIITRLTLNETGYIQRYIFDKKNNIWNLMYAIPTNPCNIYGKCGPNSVCDSNISPVCNCLKGFTPKYKEEWEVSNWLSGCVRIEPPNCQNGEGFLNVSLVKLPDLLRIQFKKNLSLNQCEAECLRNCSCTAYANPYITGENTCLMWYGDLMDVRDFTTGKNENNVYVRLPIAELDFTIGSSMKKKKKHLKVILIFTGFGVFLLGLSSACLVLKMKRKRRELQKPDEELDLPLFDLETIVAATRSFSEENRIGEGGFGTVYKGNLSTGQEVAVKRLSKDSGQGAEEFKNEVILIAKLQHRNLVRLLGCCIQGDERILIYEYMQNKSLDHFIFGSSRHILTWPKRFDIIMGIVRGLLYLHQDSRLKIIHRDLKTSNILLDSNLEPKISDFGLARIFGGDQTFLKTNRVIGTFGYMAPEYAIDGKFSDKSDVFSMGVLILEIVSGQKNRSFSHMNHHHNLLGHAWLLWNENRALEMMDSCLKDSIVECEVKRCVQVGLLCVQNFAEDRPGMSSVLSMLGNEEVILPPPKQPGFFTERSSDNSETHTSRTEWTNIGETITQLEPR